MTDSVPEIEIEALRKQVEALTRRVEELETRDAVGTIYNLIPVRKEPGNWPEPVTICGTSNSDGPTLAPQQIQPVSFCGPKKRAGKG